MNVSERRGASGARSGADTPTSAYPAGMRQPVPTVHPVGSVGGRASQSMRFAMNSGKLAAAPQREASMPRATRTSRPFVVLRASMIGPPAAATTGSASVRAGRAKARGTAMSDQSIPADSGCPASQKEK